MADPYRHHLSLRQLSEHTGVARETLRDWCLRGEMPSIKPGRTRLVHIDDAAGKLVDAFDDSDYDRNWAEERRPQVMQRERWRDRREVGQLMLPLKA